jgi:hypothetical protein
MLLIFPFIEQVRFGIHVVLKEVFCFMFQNLFIVSKHLKH